MCAESSCTFSATLDGSGGDVWECHLPTSRESESRCRFHDDSAPDVALTDTDGDHSDAFPDTLVGGAIGTLTVSGGTTPPADGTLSLVECDVDRIEFAADEGDIELSFEVAESTIGELDLSHATVDGDVSVEGCAAGGVSFRQASVRGDVSVRSTLVEGGVTGAGASVDGDVWFTETTILGTLDCTGQTARRLQFTGGLVRENVDWTRVTIDGGGFSNTAVEGSVQLDGATVDNWLTLSGAVGGDVTYSNGSVGDALSLTSTVVGNAAIGDPRYGVLSVGRLNLQGRYHGGLTVANVAAETRLDFVGTVTGPVLFEGVEFGSDVDLTVPTPDVGAVEFRECVFDGGSVTLSGDDAAPIVLDNCTFGPVDFGESTEEFFGRSRFIRPRFEDFSFSTHRVALKAGNFDLTTVPNGERITVSERWRESRSHLRGLVAALYRIEGFAAEVANAESVSLSTVAEALLVHPHEIDDLPNGGRKLSVELSGQKTTSESVDVSNLIAVSVSEWDSSLTELEERYAGVPGPTRISLTSSIGTHGRDFFQTLFETTRSQTVVQTIAAEVSDAESSYHYRRVPSRKLAVIVRDQFSDRVRRYSRRHADSLNPDTTPFDEILELLVERPALATAISKRPAGRTNSGDTAAQTHPLEVAFPRVAVGGFDLPPIESTLGGELASTLRTTPVRGATRFVADVLVRRPDVREPLAALLCEDGEFEPQPVESPEMKLLEAVTRDAPVRGIPPTEEEETYVRARAAADNSGRSRIASHFFIREKMAKRRRHRAAILSPEEAAAPTPTDAPNSGFRAVLSRFASRGVNLYHYLSNLLMWGISGYGEKPGRVVLTSVGTVIGFWAVFLTVTTDRSTLGALLLSLESFITLVLAGSDPVTSETVHIIAQVEGFLGAFMIALFVFSLTRSLHR